MALLISLNCLSNRLRHLFGWSQWVGAVGLYEALNTASNTVTTIERCLRNSAWWGSFLWRPSSMPIRRLLICRRIKAIVLSKIIIIFERLHLDSTTVFLSRLLCFMTEIISDVLMREVNVWKRQIPLADVPHNLLILPAHEIWSDAAATIYVLEILLQNFDCRLINCAFFYFLRCHILRLNRCLGIY